MLQERSPAQGVDQRPPDPRAGLNTLVTALAVGLVVALAVLAAFAVRFGFQDDEPSSSVSQPTSTTAGAQGSPQGGKQGGPQDGKQPVQEPPAGTAQGSAPAPAPAKPTPAAGLPAKPGQPVQGVQLWAKRPLGDIHQDQGSTIPLPGGRTLWIFADTFQLYNDPKFFITSSAGFTEPDSWQVHYSKTKSIPTEFLPRTPAERADRRSGEHYQAVWPTGSTRLPDGRIIISYAKYLVLLKEKDFKFLGGGLFEYRYESANALVNGGQATRIAPDLWTPADGEVRSPVYADGHVYFHQCKDLRCQALRTTPDRLTDRSSYAWWTGADWSTDRTTAQDISIGSSHPGGNASVVRLRSGGFAMADTEVGVVATSGRLWVSPFPWGPWSTAATFDFPRCPEPGCYGLNIHPSQSTDDRIRISYATNGVGPFVRVVDVPVSISSDHSSILVR
jgi:hypothetical protein